MSKGEVLYYKGRMMSDSDLEAEDNPWDDSKLREAYDKAKLLTDAADVAQRVAMATNSKNKQDGKSEKGKEKAQWKPKMPCRAVYEEDGLEYEAVVLKIIDKTLCLVMFVGYNNKEIVPISSLAPSRGKAVRDIQIAEAEYEKENATGTKSNDTMDYASEHRESSHGAEPSYNRQKKPLKKKKADKFNNVFQFPAAPHMPHIPTLAHLSCNGEIPGPPPPPPLAFPGSRIDSEEQAMSSMLLSWYMSGYYAGLYQGLKRSKEVEK